MIDDPFFEQTRFELTYAAVEAGRRSYQYGDTIAHAYLGYVASTFVGLFNVALQSGQAVGGWWYGVTPMHATLAGAFAFEFIAGALTWAGVMTLWDPEDTWSEEEAIFGFHGVGQTGYGKASKEFNPMIEGVGWPHDQYS